MDATFWLWALDRFLVATVYGVVVGTFTTNVVFFGGLGFLAIRYLAHKSNEWL